MSSKGWGRWFRLTQVARLGTVLVALWKLMRHPQTPRSAKIVAAVVVAYAVSPVDLIPDFIPVLGQLDDLVLVPLGVALAIKLTPPEVWHQCLHDAEHGTESLPRIIWGAVVIVGLWLCLIVAFVFWLIKTVLQAL